MTQLVKAVEQTRAAGFLGASEAAAALGLDPHKRPIDVYLGIHGIAVNDERPPFVQEAARWGNVLEPVVRGAYALDRRVAVVVPTDSITRGRIRATPDGFVVSADATNALYDLSSSDERAAGGANWTSLPGSTHEWRNAVGEPLTGLDHLVLFARKTSRLGGVQIKTCSREAWRHWGEMPPIHHVIQVRTEMHVCDLPWADLVYLIGGQHMEIIRIERDEIMELELVTDLNGFIDRSAAGVEPPVDASDSWRDVARARMDAAQKITLAADDHTGALLATWREQRAARKAAIAAEELTKTSLMLALGAAGATAIDGGAELGKVSAYKTGARTQWRDIAEELAGGEVSVELVARHTKGSASWALRAPRSWDGE